MYPGRNNRKLGVLFSGSLGMVLVVTILLSAAHADPDDNNKYRKGTHEDGVREIDDEKDCELDSAILDSGVKISTVSQELQTTDADDSARVLDLKTDTDGTGKIDSDMQTDDSGMEVHASPFDPVVLGILEQNMKRTLKQFILLEEKRLNVIDRLVL
jgi:hypothetical protein